jgi:hypothetical protein
MDEQRFRARLAALDAAFSPALEGTWDRRMHRAETLEDWLLRPVLVDDVIGPAVIETSERRQSCGAFMQPDWFQGPDSAWLRCDRHVTAEMIEEGEVPPGTLGWHRTAGESPVTFTTHHYVSAHCGSAQRCACGGQWPCDAAEVPASPSVSAEDLGEHGAETTAEDDHTDWRTRRGLCGTFWRNGDGQLHRCRYAPGHSGDHRCSCGSMPDR